MILISNLDKFNKKRIPFLDLVVKISNNKLATDLFIKATNRLQYLHYSPSHPELSQACKVQSCKLKKY